MGMVRIYTYVGIRMHMHMCLPYAMRYVIEAVWFCRYLAVLYVFI